VFRLDKAGGFHEVVRISTSPRAASGIDCLAVDTNKNLYVNDVSKRAAFKFEWDGSAYANPTEIASIASGAKKGIAVSDSGEVFVAVMGPPNQGWIVRRDGHGQETSFPVGEMPIWLAVGPSGNVYVPIAARSSIFVYRPDGVLVEEIPHHVTNSSASDILIDKDGVIHLAFFNNGKILRISYINALWHVEFLPQEFGTPGGIAMDSHGRLYVSDFATDSIDVVY
jgi:DNA-binding beta-propeller fold protein YncE